MRKWFIPILHFCLITGTFFAAGQPPDPNFIDKIAFSEASGKMKLAGFRESGKEKETDLIYQRLELNLDPFVNYISGKVTSCFRSLVPDLSNIQFDLTDNMTIDSVIQRKNILKFTHKGDLVNIELGASLKISATDTLSVYYRGVPVVSGFESFVVSTHNNTPILWTLSQPYGAREWWPCKQTLSDKIDSIDMIVTTPQANRTAGNGLMVEEKIEKACEQTHDKKQGFDGRQTLVMFGWAIRSSLRRQIFLACGQRRWRSCRAPSRR